MGSARISTEAREARAAYVKHCERLLRLPSSRLSAKQMEHRMEYVRNRTDIPWWWQASDEAWHVLGWPWRDEDKWERPPTGRAGPSVPVIELEMVRK